MLLTSLRVTSQRESTAPAQGNQSLSRELRAWAPQGNRLSCRDQEGRRGSEEAVPGPSVFPSGDPGVSGDVGRRRPSVLQKERRH